MHTPSKGISMKREQLETWRETRKQGALRYVLVRGVLSYGVPMFVVMTFLMRRGDIDAKFIALSAVLWGLGGAVFGIAMWAVQERLFRNAGGTSS
jgi:hypothetical protein